MPISRVYVVLKRCCAPLVTPILGRYLVANEVAETVQREHAHQADDAVLQPCRVRLRGRRGMSGRHPGQPSLAVPV